MRRLNDDHGAVAVVVAILAVAMFGFAALVIDVGALYDERRQLQNGADASALALAQSCANGACGTTSEQQALVQPYADENSRDAAANVLEICGEGAAGLAPCSQPPTVAGTGYVKVRTQTGSSSGVGEMPALLAQVLDSGYTGTTVGASAVANWGSPGGVKSDLPFTFGNCEWDYYTNSGATYPGTIDPLNWPPNEAVIFLTGGSSLCPGSPPGGDSSGGFGWLGGDVDKCSEVTVVDGFVGNKTGVGATGCDWASFVGTTVHIPVFDCHTDTTIPDPDLDPGPPVTCHGQGDPAEKGTSTRYHIVGYAAFYLTGIHVPGVKVKSLVTGNFPCKGDEKCISGFFSQGLLPSGGPVSSGPSFGTTVIGLAE